MTAQRLTRVSRPTIRRLQLDRSRLHSDVYSLHPHLGPTGRYLRPTLCSPVRDVLDHGRQRTVRVCSVMDHAACRTGTAGLGRCGHHELEPHHPIRRHIACQQCEQQLDLVADQRVQVCSSHAAPTLEDTG